MVASKYYLHYVSKYYDVDHAVYAVLTKGVRQQGAIVNAGFAEGPFDTEEQARNRAANMNAKVI